MLEEASVGALRSETERNHMEPGEEGSSGLDHFPQWTGCRFTRCHLVTVRVVHCDHAPSKFVFHIDETSGQRPFSGTDRVRPVGEMGWTVSV